jgi:hypothetical protein
MKEQEKIRFFDTSVLKESEGIRSRCTAAFVEEALKDLLPDERFRVVSVAVNERGLYRKPFNLLAYLVGMRGTVRGLPPYCEVVIEHEVPNTAGISERIIVWTPLAWNDRFAGTAGGGTTTGGVVQIAPADNGTRGWTMPFALANGFTAATCDAGNGDDSSKWAIDPETHALAWGRIENWRAGATHAMTVFGKAVAEALHRRPVRYAYMNGGSGGGRQSLVEAQDYPGDYDGIWASCPAINWTKFMLENLWPIAVMNSRRCVLKPGKMAFFAEAVRKSAGGDEAFYSLAEKVAFDPVSCVGQQTKDGVISAEDAAVMAEIWQGPQKASGERLWFGFWPGTVFWMVGLPIGFYYSLFRKRPRVMSLFACYARWVAQDPAALFNDIIIEEFESLFEKSLATFAACDGSNADLRSFAAGGAKLLIDHGTADPLIPVDGTIDYYNRMRDTLGGQEAVDAFCRLYITPGDTHGNCYGSGPGITEADGMRALMNWVEKGEAPEALRVVRIDKKTGNILKEGTQPPYKTNSLRAPA